jgi:hypothetical protein
MQAGWHVWRADPAGWLLAVLLCGTRSLQAAAKPCCASSALFVV